MFALVRFLDSDHAHDTRRYVVRVEDIHDFHPKHETDFDGKAVYVVHWEDEANGDDTATEKEARESPKRIPIPKIAVEEGSDVEGAVTKKATAARMKKTAVNRTAAKKDRYEQILKKQMSHALRQNSEQTAKRILSHKKARLVVKETAQAIWSQKGLASRSVKGGVAPGRRNLGEVAKPALTPEKVAVLEETLNHWSHVTGADSSIAARNLTSILTEKIQDCIKAERRKPPQ
ncbi:hypothetical protein HPB51_023342 [Rhipicephalus microplus]|uniref:Uncharacterized protein n=1 Tax=Rhipicephalus microplus TaxID=6941 RepID=A0A9J6DW89_RHIMP|nr:hypothetical protein HPB51_029343 [Rhipicephalus microplus]KAH8026463.1 hypothetical protein HPB51_020573 [Rhipicephalus microplus]KAH8031880.1 hypothetical protein HPB51_021069 [Rhipicephalus microplus]KAH8034338.1 hypothetical protein HPB51_023342 [Rhipicephalus microplus]